MNPQMKHMLDELSKAIQQGVLTKASHVDLNTFLCIKETHGNGAVGYTQLPYENIPQEIRAAFLYRKAGESIGQFKIVAVFDMWPEAMLDNAPQVPKVA